MTIARGLALLVSVLPCVAACRQTPEAKAAQTRAVEATRMQQLARRIAMADANPTKPVPLAMWMMPPELREISGLALTPSGHVLAHDDEVGRVYEIDPKTGIILKGFTLSGDPHGDFEAITSVGTDIYLLESDGKLFKFKEGADGEHVPYTKYDTRLGHECQFESLAFEPDSSRLLLACKKVSTKSLSHQLVIYRLPLPITDSSSMSMLTIPIAEVIGSNRWKHFQPSDIAIDPTTGNYVLVASQEKALAVITPDGEVVRSEPLPGDHNQAEGVAITRDSLLIVSDEATHKPAAITLYRWRP
ncbi:MAG: SdiA-regulated domain-containing protein [Gemmatimonadota bacterium]|nr:SdiA-regulated domain-containing protein [Gemmatimonadota bacterium]